MAVNYNSLANTDSGECESEIIGCMNPLAFNYNPEANTDTDPSSCIATIQGCMDESAANYNENANIEGECIEVVYGCMFDFPFIENYNPLATVNQFSAEDNSDPCIYDFGSRSSNEVCIDPLRITISLWLMKIIHYIIQLSSNCYFKSCCL